MRTPKKNRHALKHQPGVVIFPKWLEWTTLGGCGQAIRFVGPLICASTLLTVKSCLYAKGIQTWLWKSNHSVILWMDKILHHLRNHGKPLLVGVYRGIVIPGILRWCRISTSIHGIKVFSQPSLICQRNRFKHPFSMLKRSAYPALSVAHLRFVRHP